ncbi:MAG: IPT/TIG domain-containing protein [Phycisphaerales bacterium]|nr:MAG: IPT/TIG domain-containing protein [Phycisphaerales bacterium]
MFQQLLEVGLLCIATLIVGCSASDPAVRALNLAARNLDRCGYASVAAPCVIELSDHTEFRGGSANEANLPLQSPQTETVPETVPPLQLPEAVAQRGPPADLSRPRAPADIPVPGTFRITGTDVWARAILRSLGRFRRNERHDYALLVFPLLVSVQPGHYTRHGYAAEITVKVDLARMHTQAGQDENGSPRPAYRWEYLSEHYPDSTPPIRAVAVLPFDGGETVDIADHRRQVLSFSSELALLGLETQADYFRDYANSLAEDRPRRTAINTASAHNVGSTAFGFRLDPGAGSSTSRTKGGARAGESLESGTVPALAFVFVPAEHLHRRAQCHDCCPVPEDLRDPYEFLVLEANTRWSRLTLPPAWGPCIAETDRWNRAAKLERAAALIEGLPPSGHRDHLEAQLAALSRLMLDARSFVPLSDARSAGSICVDSIQPERGWWDQQTVLTISGCGFSGNVRAVTVGGVACCFEVANDRTLRVEVPPWGEVRKTETPTSDGTAPMPSLTPSESRVAVVNLPPNAFLGGDPSGQVGHVEPLTPSERRELAELEQRLACSELLPPEARQRLQTLSKKWSAVENAWARDVLEADIVIAADVPVCSSVVGQDDASSDATSGFVGSIVFGKQLARFYEEPAPVCPPVGPPRVSVRQGNQVVNVTTCGDPAGIAKLLEFLKEALKPEEQISFELIGEGFKLTEEGLTKDTRGEDEN